MKSRFSIKQRLILPIVLLGVVALISNALSIYSIHKVDANAVDIADNYMDGAAKLADIRRILLNTHKMALSHIVAADYDTMITIVNQIKQEEEELSRALEDFAVYLAYIPEGEAAAYTQLKDDYGAFCHALVSLVCASADSKTQEAYACANGDVAYYSSEMEQKMAQLDDAISSQARQARQRLKTVYHSSIIVMGISSVAGVILVIAAISILLKYVVKPIQHMMKTLHGSSERMNEVVGEVLERTKNSNKSARGLHSVTESLSAAIRKVAGSVSKINASVLQVNGDVDEIVQECGSITDYASAMKMRAGEMEQSAQMNTEIIRKKVDSILEVLNQAIKNSESVDQVNSLTKDILNISTTTNLIALNASVEASHAGQAGKGFAVVAGEIRELADSCAKTATRIQEVNGIVTDTVHNLSQNAQELVDYLNKKILKEFQVFVCAGQQYNDDAAYIEQKMEKFNSKEEQLRSTMQEIAVSLESISNAISEGAGGITGAAGSTKSLAGDMADITRRMDINYEIVEELRRQTEVFANL